MWQMVEFGRFDAADEDVDLVREIVKGAVNLQLSALEEPLRKILQPFVVHDGRAVYYSMVTHLPLTVWRVAAKVLLQSDHQFPSNSSNSPTIHSTTLVLSDRIKE